MRSLSAGKSSSLTSTSSASASLASYLFLLASSTAAAFSLASCLSFRVSFTYLSSSLIYFLRLAILLSTSVFSEDSAGGAGAGSTILTILSLSTSFSGSCSKGAEWSIPGLARGSESVLKETSCRGSRDR